MACGGGSELTPVDPGTGVVLVTGVPVSAAGPVLQTLWLAALAVVWLLTRPGASGLRRTDRTPRPGDPPGRPPPAAR